MKQNLRIGFGTVWRALSAGTGINLCGIEFICGFKWDEQAGADPLTLALADALLGASGFGGVSDFVQERSTTLPDIAILKDIERKNHYSGFTIINIDVTIQFNNTGITSIFPDIIKNLTKDLFIKPEQINLKLAQPLPQNAGHNGLQILSCSAVVMIGPRST